MPYSLVRYHLPYLLESVTCCFSTTYSYNLEKILMTKALPIFKDAVGAVLYGSLIFLYNNQTYRMHVRTYSHIIGLYRRYPRHQMGRINV